MIVLALNCGSSSVKYELYRFDKREVMVRGMVERVGIGGSRLTQEVPGKPIYELNFEGPDHEAALEFILKSLSDPQHGVIKELSAITAVGHRVVHGGEKFARSVRIDAQVLEAIREVQDLAPLHNPHNIAGIEAAQKILPGVPQVAVFDTAFHQTMPPSAYIYAVPYEWYKMYGVRRYGFHGTSHLYVSKRAAALLGKKPSEVRVITMHVGNGVSIAAVKAGQSVDTSMGLTPLEGALMGTRSGSLDPAIIPFMVRREGLKLEQVESILNKKSGLLGITGKYTDRRDIEREAAGGNERCRLALEMEAYGLKKYIGAYAAAMGGVEAVAFTAGAGEHSATLRERVLSGMEFLGVELDKDKNKSAVTSGKESVISTDESRVKVFVIPTDEELVFVEDVVAILEGRYDTHTHFNYSFQDPGYQRK